MSAAPEAEIAVVKCVCLGGRAGRLGLEVDGRDAQVLRQAPEAEPVGRQLRESALHGLTGPAHLLHAAPCQASTSVWTTPMISERDRLSKSPLLGWLLNGRSTCSSAPQYAELSNT